MILELIRKRVRSQIEVVNQKKYDIFEQEVQYKENSIKTGENQIVSEWNFYRTGILAE